MATRFLAVRGRQQGLPLVRNTVGNITAMAVRRFSISFEQDLAERVRAQADAQGVTISAWLAAAAERSLRHEGWRELFADYEAEHGPITDDDRRRAAAELGIEPQLGSEW